MPPLVLRLVLVVSLSVFGLFALGLVGAWKVAAGLHHDYNKRPASEAFELFFHQQPPGTVADLAAAGESWPGGSNVWLRFRADEATVSHLVSGWNPAAPWPADDMWWTMPDLVQRYDLERRVHSSEIGKLKNAKYYQLEHPGGHTTVAVDRARRLVYGFYWSQ